MSKWDLLILTQPSRAEFMKQLSVELTGQIGGLDVGIIAKDFDTSRTLGDNRNILRDMSEAEYISFFDDDDWPAPDFISRTYPLLDGVDYIGFQVQCYCVHQNWMKYGATFHSLEYSKRPAPWSREGAFFYRDIVHINPMLRKLAIQADFDGDFGEDCRWATRIRQKDICKTQHYIPEVMYHYIWRAAKHDYSDARDPVRAALIDTIRSGKTNLWSGRHIPDDLRWTVLPPALEALRGTTETVRMGNRQSYDGPRVIKRK